MTKAIASLVVVLCLFVATKAYAQESLVTAAAGLASTHDGGTGLFGAVGSLDYRLSRRWSAVGTITHTTGSSEGYFSNWSWTDTFGGGGLRFSGRPWPRVEPFVHGLIGALHTTGLEQPDFRLPRGFVFVDGSYTETVAAVVAGGGVSLYATPRVGIRVGLDLQMSQSASQGRFTGELVVGIGSR